jgi:hypothetical protein
MKIKNTYQDALISVIIFQFIVFYGTANFTTITEAPQNNGTRFGM